MSISMANETLPAGCVAFRRRFRLEAAEMSGATWKFRQTQSGAPVLLALPGALGTGDVFYRTADDFGRRFNVVTIGYPPLENGDALADGLASLLDRLGAREAILLSSSLGGYVAQVFARKYPERTRLVVLGNTFRDPASQQARWPAAAEFARSSAAVVLADARRRLQLGEPDTPQAVELKAVLLALVGAEQSPETVRAARLAVLNAVVQPKLSLDPGRIALIDDDADPVIAPDTREDIRRTYVECRQERIAGGGHYPSILAPDAYRAALERILDNAGC